MILKILLTITFISTILFSSEISLPKRVKIALSPKKYGMVLLDSNYTKTLSNEHFIWIDKFNKIDNHYIARAKALNNKIGYIDTKGKWIIPATFDIAKNFSEGIARVKKDDKWGYVKSNGTWLIKEKFDYVLPFQNGFGVVEFNKNEKGYIDKDGKLMNKKFVDAKSFCSNGIAYVAKQIKGRILWGEIDKNGKIISPFTLVYDDKELKCKKNRTARNSNKEQRYYVTTVQNRWKIIKNKNNLPKDILAPLGNFNKYGEDFGFTDGLIAMVDKNRTIQYLDYNGKKILSYHPNKSLYYALFLNNKEIYTTNIKAFKTYCYFSRRAYEHFIDIKDYNQNRIIVTIKNMLKEKFKRYEIPNLLYVRDSNKIYNPYKLKEDSEDIKLGVVKILAQGYVSEEAWGNYDFLVDIESMQFKKYFNTIAKWITDEFGKPIKHQDYRYVWKIGSKYLTLEKTNGYGDGDFYNMLALELNKGK